MVLVQTEHAPSVFELEELEDLDGRTYHAFRIEDVDREGGAASYDPDM
jgi:hypothetical protein